MPVGNIESRGALSADSLVRLGPLDAILHRIPEPENTRTLTADEVTVLGFADGVLSVREILEKVPIDAEPAAAALQSLQNDGFVYTEIPAYSEPGTLPPTMLPPTRQTVPPTRMPGQSSGPRIQASQPKIQPSFPKVQPSQARVPREGTPQPQPSVSVAAPAVDRGRTPSRAKWVFVAVALIVLAGAGVFLWRYLYQPPPVLVQVDASPFARTIIKTEKNEVLFVEDTPFQKDLPPGTYIFEFVNGPLIRSEKVNVSAKLSGVIRVDFWTAEQTNRLIQTIK
jgi:hypothetical protein